MQLPCPVGDTAAFVAGLFAARGPVFAGFDFPIGIPMAYARLTGCADFLTALEVFGQGEWSDFFRIAETPQQISPTRPFYPRSSTAGMKQAHLYRALGFNSMDVLRRQCEQATPTRKAACPLFWTLGANQVGRSAISGWQEVVRPARRRGAHLWPFEGGLAELTLSGAPVLAETYPAEAYAHVGVALRSKMSKRRQGDRRAAMAGLPDWAQERGVTFSKELTTAIAAGFSPSGDDEDMFDALVGALGMIEVVDGRRAERHSDPSSRDVWEGWIVGQCDLDGRYPKAQP